MNKLHIGQKGFSPVFIIIIIVLVLLLGFAGWQAWNQNQTEPTTDTQLTEEADEIDEGERVSPLDNSYNVIKPAGWATKTCEFEGSEGVLFLAPDESYLGACASESGGTIFASRTPGDNRISDEDYAGSDWISDFASEDAEFGGLNARKISYTVTAENELGHPPVGTKIIQYQAFDGTHTYSMNYMQLPTTPDYTAEFEAVVNSLRI